MEARLYKEVTCVYVGDPAPCCAAQQRGCAVIGWHAVDADRQAHLVWGDLGGGGGVINQTAVTQTPAGALAKNAL